VPPSQPDPPGRRPGGSRRRIVLITGAVLVLVVIVEVVITQLVDRPSSSSAGRLEPARAPGTSTDASGGPPSSELSGQPTAAELLTHVPADFRNTCQVDDKDVRGAALKLVCHPTGDPISTIYLWQYASSAEFGAAVDKTFTATEKSDCSSGQARITMRSRPRVARHGPAFCSARRSHR
jgi:hypothetical protein